MKVFMPTYGGGHVNIVIPVAIALRKLGVDVVILGLTTACIILNDKIIQYKKLKDYLFLYREDELKKIEAIGERLAQANHNSELISFEDTKYYYGIGMYSLILEKGEKEAFHLFGINGRKAFQTNDFMKRVLKYENPDVVTSSCNVRYEKAAVEEAKSIGIAVYFFCDFLYFNLDGADNFKGIFCLNETQKEFFIYNGIKEEKLHVIGQPAFDSLFNMNITKEVMSEELNIDIPDKIILWICSEYPSVRGMLEIYEDIKIAASRLNDFTFVIKIHPSGNANYFKSENNIHVVKNYVIQKIIYNADIVIGTVSTAVHEALLLNKPVIMPNYLNEDYGIASHYYKSGSVMYLDVKGSLTQRIKDMTSSKELQDQYLINRRQYEIKPDSAFKAAEFIISQRSIE